MRPIRAIIIHHAGAPADAETIDRWHRERGWSGIGYHYVIRADGQAEPGRPERVAGAHAKGVNATTLGICMGVDAREGVPELCYQGAVLLAANLCRRFGLGAGDVRGHSEVGTTETVCPVIDMDSFRAEVARWLEADRA